MQGLARPALLDIAQDYAKGKNIADEDLEFVASVFTFALVGIMTEWVADGMSQEYQDKLDKFFLIIDGTMEATLAKFIQ